ncbi:hypothetical protein [Roseibium sp.]|uniref:hypothetical protein n=1 Tax=Roseibium sp. TaxID=1936156 RepID=UPI003A987527
MTSSGFIVLRVTAGAAGSVSPLWRCGIRVLKISATPQGVVRLRLQLATLRILLALFTFIFWIHRPLACANAIDCPFATNIKKGPRNSSSLLNI